MPGDIQEKKKALLDRIVERRRNDERWGRQNFYWAQFFVWLAIVSSFGSAIASATNKIPPVVIAIFAAIPGTVIVIDKSFGLARRARWHWMMVARLEKLENALAFEEKSVEEVSKALSDLRLEMEGHSPVMAVDGLSDSTPKA